MQKTQLPEDYDIIRKMIMKNLQIKHYLPSSFGLVPINLTDLVANIIRDIQINPDVVIQLSEYFKEKLDEKEN